MTEIFTYEHTNGNALDYPTENLVIEVLKQQVITRRADGAMIVHEVARWYKFSLTTILSSTDYITTLGWHHAATAYTGAYPRVTAAYIGSTNFAATPIEVSMIVCRGLVLADKTVSVTLEFQEKTA